jgi:hypothetical protein
VDDEDTVQVLLLTGVVGNGRTGAEVEADNARETRRFVSSSNSVTVGEDGGNASAGKTEHALLRRLMPIHVACPK